MKWSYETIEAEADLIQYLRDAELRSFIKVHQCAC